MPEIDLEKVSFLIEKAREFEVPEGVIEEDEDDEVYEEGQEAFDEDSEELHTGFPDDPAFAEAKAQIEDMNVDEQVELVALAWVGRGDYAKEEWAEALRTARQQHNNRTAEYLLGMPHLADHLQDALDAFDLNVEV